MSTWLNHGLKSILELEDEHSSSVYSLLENRLNKPISWVLSHPEYVLRRDEEDLLNKDLNRLLSGEPLAYITSRSSFYGSDFFVTQDVLIPRPETELLIEEALVFLKSINKPLWIADVGTGSGCIAVSIASATPLIHVIASDICFKSLQIAKINAQQNHMYERIHLVQTNLLDGIETKFDLICGNLPYIPSRVLDTLPVLNHEPRLALDGGEDGLYVISQLLRNIKEKIQPGGSILLEIENTQSDLIKTLSRNLFPSANCTIKKDLAEHPRLAIIEMGE